MNLAYYIIPIYVLLFIIYNVLFYNSTLYNMVFNKEEYKILKELNHLDINEFSYVDIFMFNNEQLHKFKCNKYPNWSINVVNNQPAFVSDEKTHKCIVSTFYKKGCNKLTKKLMDVI